MRELNQYPYHHEGNRGRPKIYKTPKEKEEARKRQVKAAEETRKRKRRERSEAFYREEANWLNNLAYDPRPSRHKKLKKVPICEGVSLIKSTTEVAAESTPKPAKTLVDLICPTT